MYKDKLLAPKNIDPTVRYEDFNLYLVAQAPNKYEIKYEGKQPSQQLHRFHKGEKNRIKKELREKLWFYWAISSSPREIIGRVIAGL